MLQPQSRKNRNNSMKNSRNGEVNNHHKSSFYQQLFRHRKDSSIQLVSEIDEILDVRRATSIISMRSRLKIPATLGSISTFIDPTTQEELPEDSVASASTSCFGNKATIPAIVGDNINHRREAGKEAIEWSLLKLEQDCGQNIVLEDQKDSQRVSGPPATSMSTTTDTIDLPSTRNQQQLLKTTWDKNKLSSVSLMNESSDNFANFFY
ncbi:hypothetical protein CRE_26955 [Caenorhabditis remanei]|uniref:Uncharacterized protein n=1 Tax=Caenorhabditis remanei TaxID=31234 RepID=E3LPG5_CAERE|nr:hypothetical protein CRE_26955 [Caenorhabditis remanei]